MARHTKRIIREGCIKIADAEDASPAETLKAITVLWKLESSRVKCKPRGKPFPKKNRGSDDARERLDRIISAVN